MGQGGYLNLVNATPHEWKRTLVHSYQMNSWDDSFPESLGPGLQKRCYIEFSEGILENSGDDAGEVTYSIQGTSLSFQIQVRGRPNFHLQVDWKNTPGNGFFVFPPPANGPSHIGWVHDGTLSMAVGYLSSKDSQSSVGREPMLSRWMQLYAPVLKKLTVHDLTLPGTHDSGTYDMVTPFKKWTATQDLSIGRQLQAGTRSLDLRVGYQLHKSGNEKFILVHDTWRSHVAVADALRQTVTFSQANPQEIVVLDFHRFVDLGDGGFDYAGLISLIKSCLDVRMIPPNDQRKSLNDLWQNSTRRIVVAFNSSNSDPAFWPGVDQKWAGSDVTSADGLKKYIEATVAQPLPSGLWSFQAAVAPLTGPPVLSPELGNWFHGGTQWSQAANIIAVDWIEKTSISEASACASFLKGIKVMQG